MNQKLICLFAFVFLFSMHPKYLCAQLTAPLANGTAFTEYPVYNETDEIFIFCGTEQQPATGELTATTDLTGTKTFLWEKYNPQAAAFEFYFSESVEGTTSSVDNLSAGCYRVTITQGATTEIYRAWLLSDWFTADGIVTESNCEMFRMEGSYTTADLIYYDIADNSEVRLSKAIITEWRLDNEIVSVSQNFSNYDPPAKNTDYSFRVLDQFGCEAIATVSYNSIVTKAKFSTEFVDQEADSELEAPLTVNFINESENGDSGLYEWFFFRDLNKIKEEAENSSQPIDSIEVIGFNDSPTYTYENTGNYMVKLVSKKVSEANTCVDTFYMKKYIFIDTAFIEAPNVFTPNGDGTNDEYIIKFWSMKSLKISIFNRWGQRVHFWKSGDVRGFYGTVTQTVWDGRIGGRYASPGVYYYVVEGEGRDGKNKRAHGFIHLFRGK